MKSYNIGIIGGSGIYSLNEFRSFDSHLKEERVLEESVMEHCDIEGHNLFFLPRHGKGHTTLPHDIDYLLHMRHFSSLGVDFIVSFCTVGSLVEKLPTGMYVIPTDIIDATQHRKGYAYVRDNKHVDMRPLFNEQLVSLLTSALERSDISSTHDGILVVIEGPRFATLAEQRMYRGMGGSLLNMTQAQEIYLSHVFEIPFITLCHVTDLTAIVDHTYDIASKTAVDVFMGNKSKVEKILLSLLLCINEYQPKIEYHYEQTTFI